jgi:hypothetical protein
MMPRSLASFIFLASLATSVLGLGACRDRYEWRQKLTMTVDTPSGERIGSSVVQVEVLFGQLPASGNEVEHKLKGEAVVVEISAGHYLFALLNEGTKELAAGVWEDQLPQSRRDWLPRIADLHGERELPSKLYPMLATFADINDPKSVQEVKPEELAAAFGPGVKLESITLSITDEPVTERLQNVLKWLGVYPEAPILPKIDRHDFSFAANLRQGDFLRR